MTCNAVCSTESFWWSIRHVKYTLVTKGGKELMKKTSLMLTTCKTYFKWTVHSVIFCLIFTADHFLLTSSENLRNYFQLESEKGSFLLREWCYSLIIFMAAKRKSFRKSCKINYKGRNYLSSVFCTVPTTILVCAVFRTGSGGVSQWRLFKVHVPWPAVWGSASRGVLSEGNTTDAEGERRKRSTRGMYGNCAG